MTDPLIFYTDGSADAKGQIGSWAFVRVSGGEISAEASGRVRKTNSAQMEIQAAIEALASLPHGDQQASNIVIRTDCKMLIEAMTELVPIWKANDWRKPRTNKAIANVDLYKQLDALSATHSITWCWIKSHSGHQFNERCDELCRLARA